MGYVQSFLEHTKIYESPTSFWKWSAYATIAATLRDNIWRQQGDITLFPNIFVLFLAESGFHRKGNPINIAGKMLALINNTKVISGRASIQAMIDELAHSETDKKSGKLVKGGAAIFLASELAAGIVQDPAAVGILTDIYDLKTDFKHHLRSTGKLKIDRIVFSLLAGSNETLLKETYDQRAVSGGLLARTFLVIPNEFRDSNSLWDVPTSPGTIKQLEDNLRRVSELVGEIEVEDEAKKEYDRWYKPFREDQKNRRDKAGVTGRIHTGIIKLSMILAANDLSMIIKKCHIEEAIVEAVNLIPNYNTFVMSSGKSTIAEAGAMLLPEMMKAQGCKLSKSEILSKHWMNVDSETLDKLMIALEQGGLVTQIVVGSQIYYQLTQKAVDGMSHGS